MRVVWLGYHKQKAATVSLSERASLYTNNRESECTKEGKGSLFVPVGVVHFFSYFASLWLGARHRFLTDIFARKVAKPQRLMNVITPPLFLVRKAAELFYAAGHSATQPQK